MLAFWRARPRDLRDLEEVWLVCRMVSEAARWWPWSTVVEDLVFVDAVMLSFPDW